MGGSLLVFVASAFTFPSVDASQIPAAGKALVDLLWAAGVGWFGSALLAKRLNERWLTLRSGNLSVWISQRLLCSPTD
jgi:hypothetical protein